jgi:DNA helicase HerA-like ATPase
MSEEARRIGHVISVSGAKLSGVLSPSGEAGTNGSAADVGRMLQIGNLVKVSMPKSVAYGLVSKLEIRDPSGPPNGHDCRIIEIDLFGESLCNGNGSQNGVENGAQNNAQNGALDGALHGEANGTHNGSLPAGQFQRGVSVYPSLGDEIYSASSDELAVIYKRPTVASARMGTLHQDQDLPVYLMTDELLGKHFSILGTSGSGKSCALSVILQSILDDNPSGHVVLLDPHNEYSQAFGERANVITTVDLQLPFWLLNFEELSEVLCSPEPSAREAEMGILKEAIIAAKLSFAGDTDEADYLTVDTPVPFRLSSLVQHIDKAMGDFERTEQIRPYMRLKGRIDRLRSDRRFAFMFAGVSVRDNMADIVCNILRIPVERQPISIFDLSGVPSEIVDVLVSLLCRMIFDFAMWSARDEAVPVLVVCEEAHRYIPRDPGDGFGPTRKAISRIAKEGRKYGVSLCLVTQRPSELSETILSQCNTLFALRMSNDRDQEFVRRTLPESAAGMMGALPALRTQEAVVVGEGVTLPMRIRFDNLAGEEKPLSETACFSSAWQREIERDEDFVLDTLDRWRRQAR